MASLRKDCGILSPELECQRRCMEQTSLSLAGGSRSHSEGSIPERRGKGSPRETCSSSSKYELSGGTRPFQILPSLDSICQFPEWHSNCKTSSGGFMRTLLTDFGLIDCWWRRELGERGKRRHQGSRPQYEKAVKKTERKIKGYEEGGARRRSKRERARRRWKDG
jgi:hypothetical protein